MLCCVFNCTNPKCNRHRGPSRAQKAGATAHVYGTFQSSDHDIWYMILLPTCQTSTTHNSHKYCQSKKANYPVEGEEPSKILYTVPGAQLMFIEVGLDKTVDGKGEARKGSGKRW